MFFLKSSTYITDEFFHAFSFNKKKTLQHHVRVEHQYVRHVCHICAKEYRTLGGFQEHLLSHNSVGNSSSIQCKLCPSIFKNVLRLRRHMARHRKNSTELQCPHCSKKKPNMYLLKEHIAGRHNYKVHKCRLCEREFRTPAEVTVGIFVHLIRSVPFSVIREYIFIFPIASHENTHDRRSVSMLLLYQTVQSEALHDSTHEKDASRRMDNRSKEGNT